MSWSSKGESCPKCGGVQEMLFVSRYCSTCDPRDTVEDVTDDSEFFTGWTLAAYCLHVRLSEGGGEGMTVFADDDGELPCQSWRLRRSEWSPIADVGWRCDADQPYVDKLSKTLDSV